jgi:hypothetical protein
MHLGILNSSRDIDTQLSRISVFCALGLGRLGGVFLGDGLEDDARHVCVCVCVCVLARHPLSARLRPSVFGI